MPYKRRPSKLQQTFQGNRDLLRPWQGVNDKTVDATQRAARRKLADWLAKELARAGLSVVRVKL